MTVTIPFLFIGPLAWHMLSSWLDLQVLKKVFMNFSHIMWTVNILLPHLEKKKQLPSVVPVCSSSATPLLHSKHCSLLFFVLKLSHNPILWTISEVETFLWINGEKETQREMQLLPSVNNLAYIIRALFEVETQNSSVQVHVCTGYIWFWG